MTFGLPIAPATLALWATAVAGLLVLAYVLKLRRRAFEVPFSRLWQRVLEEKDTTSLWRRLRRLLSLLIQLVVAALLIGAVMDPRLGQARGGGRSIVLILDASASMKANDSGDGSRMTAAQRAARQIVEGLGGADTAMIVRMDGQPTSLSRFESDRAALRRVIDDVEPSDTPADLPRALRAAADALRDREKPLIIIVGDGAYPAAARDQIAWEGAPNLAQVDLRGIDVRFSPVGSEARNVGVTSFNVRRYIRNKLSYEALVEVQSFSDTEENVQLAVYADDDPVSVEALTLAAGERVRRVYPDLGGEGRVLRAKLTHGGDTQQPTTENPGRRHSPPVAGTPDAFPLDDEAVALLPARKKQTVLLVGEDNLYLEGALLLDENLTVDKVRPAAYPPANAATYDVVVFDGWAPPTPPEARAAVYFNPPAAQSPIAVSGELPRPYITDLHPDHPVTRWISLADVNFDRSHVLRPVAGDAVLASSVRAPVAVAGVRDGKKVVVFGFGLDGTDLVLRVAFPILLVNTMEWIAGSDAELLTTYATGRAWTVPVQDAGLTSVPVLTPTGAQVAPVAHGRARFFGRDAGLYTLQAPSGDLHIAANLANPAESDIAPGKTLTLGGRALEAPPELSPSASRHLWRYLVLAALLILGIEWLTYHRRVTV